MKRKTPLLFKFLLPVVVVLIAVGILINYVASKEVTSILLSQASTQAADFVHLQAKRHHIQPSDFDITNPDRFQHFKTLLDEIHTQNVLRIKVWDNRDTVVYSDDRRLIGKNFGANDSLDNSLRLNTIETEITAPKAAENVDERQYSHFMEIYIPISDEHNKPVGVIETYYRLNGVDAAIRHFQHRLMVIDFGALTFLACVIFILLRLTILKPISKLGKATHAVAKGRLDRPIKVRSHDELGALAEAFNHMLLGLRRLQELKDEFVFIAAHELRAPVTVIRGYLDMIRENPKQTKQYVAEIENANQRLELLVTDLLEIARNDAGKVSLQLAPIDPIGVIQSQVRLLENTAAARNIHLIFDPPEKSIRINADSKRFGEIFMNLLSNSIKYGTEGGSTKISCLVRPGAVTFSVRDDGVGMTDDEVKHLFQKFYRTASAQQSTVTGTGLGLYITRELVRRMHGTITVHSQPGSGTNFVLTFPTL